MPQFYDIGGNFTLTEGRKAVAAIVPPHIRSLAGYSAMVEKLQKHLPNWFAHEVNRARGIAFTSGSDAGFSHSRKE